MLGPPKKVGESFRRTRTRMAFTWHNTPPFVCVMTVQNCFYFFLPRDPFLIWHSPQWKERFDPCVCVCIYSISGCLHKLACLDTFSLNPKEILSMLLNRTIFSLSPPSLSFAFYIWMLFCNTKSEMVIQNSGWPSLTIKLYFKNFSLYFCD